MSRRRVAGIRSDEGQVLMSDWGQDKVSIDVAPTRDRIRLMIGADMRQNSQQPDSLSLK